MIPDDNYGVSQMEPPTVEQLALQRELAKQFFAYVAQVQRDQEVEIHRVLL